MKNIFIIFSILIVGIINSYSITKNIGDDYQVVYNILDTAGNYITGQTVTVAIEKISNSYWYDFSDNTFKFSGWGNKTTNLTEDSVNQFYYYTFSPPATEILSEEYIFILNNANATYKDHSIIVVNYQDIGTSTTTPKEIWNFTTREITGGTADSLTTNLDKTGYSATLTEKVTAYSLLNNQDKSGYSGSGTLTEKVIAYTLINNQDKIGYSGILTENVTAYILINNQDKTGYLSTLTEQVTAYTLIDKNNFNCILATPTPKGIEDIADKVWDEIQSGHVSAGTFGKYLDAQISLSSATWSPLEKALIKSALTIEFSTPTWRLDMIDRDIRIFR